MEAVGRNLIAENFMSPNMRWTNLRTHGCALGRSRLLVLTYSYVRAAGFNNKSRDTKWTE
jgi:hypothetical protein